MPFDDPRENQDEMQTPPRRFGYPFVDDEDDAINPAIALQPEIAPTFMPQRRSAEPQVSSKPGIGQQIVAMGNREMPPFDIQDGRAVWRNDPATLPKPNIGQRIVGMAPSRVVQPTPLPNFNPSQPRQREQLPYIFPRSSSDQMYGRQELFGASTPDRADRSPNWRSNSGDNPSPSSQPTVSPVSSSRVGPADRSVPGFSGQPEYLRGPLDLNEFASFLGAGEPRSVDSQNLFAANSKQDRQPRTGGVPEALGRTAGAATGAASTKVIENTAQAQEAWLGRGQPGRGKKNPPIPPVTGSVGIGGKNNPADVKWVQQLLNAAIDDEELTGEKIPEDGKVTDAMLKLLGQYQSANGLAREAAIDYKSRSIRKLAENPLFDPRWSKYDETIKKEVAYYNDFFSKHYPEGFQPLDWRRVKAMLWVEVEGPDVPNPIEWLVWPMQIGRKRLDPGMPAVKYGLENTDRYVPEDLRYKLQHQRMTAELNIRAGVGYLYDRAIANWKNLWRVTDPTVQEYQVQPGDTLEGIAKAKHTTVGELLQDNNLNKDTATSIRPNDRLKYRLATEVPQWYDWPTASFRYNARGNPNYAAEVERNYRKIKRRW